MKPIKLDIEKKPKLLARYGLCMALTATVENLLFSAIATAKILPRSEVKKQLHGKTLGALIKDAKNVLDNNLLAELYKLNEERIILAHGIVIEKKIFNKGMDQNRNGVTQVRNFTLGELNKTIKEARSLSGKLLKYIERLLN